MTLTRHPRQTLHAPAHVVFAFHADTAGATFRCALDGRILRPCRSPVAYTVRAGRHRFRGRAPGGGVTGPTVAFRFSVVRGR